jgi:hypothetical protein
MPNSDNTYGTFNKRTSILSQTIESPITFADVATAKSHFYKAEALAVFDECCTQLEWAIVDSTKLKYTMAFGTKGGNIAAADDWAGQFNSRKTTLINSNGWGNNAYSSEEVDSHLF